MRAFQNDSRVGITPLESLFFLLLDFYIFIFLFSNVETCRGTNVVDHMEFMHWAREFTK